MIAKFSVKKPYTVLVGVVLVIVLGIVSFTRMTTDLLPDMSLPYALVITTDMGASPEEVEMDVTAPIEAAMATTSNIKNVSSVSYDNYSMVILEYEQSANMDSVLIEMQQKLDQLEGRWADTVGTPMIMQIDPDMMPIMVASADVQGMTQSEVSSYVENELMPALESVEGIASVSTTGVLEETVQVTLDEDKIAALNEDILAKIEEQFADAQAELDDAKAEIESGKSQLESGKAALAEQTANAQNEIINGKLKVYVGESEIRTNLTLLTQMKPVIEKAIPILQSAYDSGMALKEKIEQLEAAQTPEQQELLEELKKQLAELWETISGQRELLEGIGIIIESFEDIPQAIADMTQMLAEANTNIALLKEAQGQIAGGRQQLDEASVALTKGQIDGILKMSEAAAKLADAEAQLAMGQAQLDEAKQSATESADLETILTTEMVGNLLVAQNFSMPAGYVGENDKQYVVRVGDRLESVEDLKNVVLLDMGMDGIAPIHLSDVAEVKLVDNSAESYSKVNGNPAIMLSIEKQTGYSTGEVSDRALEKFAALERENGDLRISVLMNQGVYIDIIVDSVLQNMIFGAFLAILVLIVFLKDFKPTMIIACSIPLSVIFAIVLMYFTDISLNIISLSGLALGIGMLVDNSIVVIENIYRLKSEGYSIRKAAVEGAGQVTGAIIASTLTTICVFAPIVFTEGITRQLFVDIALTIAFTLTASLVVALTFVPMMAAGVLKTTKEVRHEFFEKVQDAYEKALELALRHRAVVLVGVLVLLVASAVAAFSRGFSFIDMNMETNQLTVTVGPKEEQVLDFEELTAMSDEVVEKISTIEGVETIGAMAGGGGTMAMMGGGGGASITMYLLLDEEADVSASSVAGEITSLTKDMDCEVAVDASASDMTAMFGSGITVQVSGSDLDRLQELAAEVAELAEAEEGTTEVDAGLDNTTPSFTVHVDKEKAAEYGMTTAQVFQLVYAEMASDTSPTTISTDLKDYEVYIQTEKQKEASLADIRDLTFTYTDREGNEEEIALSEIADFEEGSSLNIINRDAQTRYISVTAGVDENHNVSLVANSLEKKLAEIELPEGYAIEMTGEDEMIDDAMQQLYLMLLLAVIFIYLIMVAQFQSLLSPFIIMFTIPLAFTGGLFALFVTGNEVSVIAMIGFVMLAGIIVNNGIVMVDYINQLRREGMDKHEAIVESGKTRLRPILMTALTTILSMSTMAFGFGDGSEMMQPMAIVTEGGMIYGTLLTLFVVPCIYDLFNRNKSMVEEEL